LAVFETSILNVEASILNIETTKLNIEATKLDVVATKQCLVVTTRRIVATKLKVVVTTRSFVATKLKAVVTTRSSVATKLEAVATAQSFVTAKLKVVATKLRAEVIFLRVASPPAGLEAAPPGPDPIAIFPELSNRPGGGIVVYWTAGTGRQGDAAAPPFPASQPVCPASENKHNKPKPKAKPWPTMMTPPRRMTAG